mmetsp:Transcript_10426/g.28708  ORF Transcript_10426/g.28708 Transcript_10426/m.28708 type:complete len:218 (-) Transcript_10426:291-944(-)
MVIMIAASFWTIGVSGSSFIAFFTVRNGIVNPLTAGDLPFLGIGGIFFPFASFWPSASSPAAAVAVAVDLPLEFASSAALLEAAATSLSSLSSTSAPSLAVDVLLSSSCATSIDSSIAALDAVAKDWSSASASAFDWSSSSSSSSFSSSFSSSTSWWLLLSLSPSSPSSIATLAWSFASPSASASDSALASPSPSSSSSSPSVAFDAADASLFSFSF